MRVVELVREPLQLLERSVVVGVRPGAPHTREDRRAVALGEMPDDIPLLMAIMATSP